MGFLAAIISEAPGALPNGTRILKINSKDEDTHGDGAAGTVTGSLSVPEEPEFADETYFYFIEWDDLPALPIGIRGSRIRAAEADIG